MRRLLFLTIAILLLAGCQASTPQAPVAASPVAQATVAAQIIPPATAAPSATPTAAPVVASPQPTPTPVTPTSIPTKPPSPTPSPVPPTAIPTETAAPTTAPTATVRATASSPPEAITPAGPEVEEKATKPEDIVGEWTAYDPQKRKLVMRFLSNGRWDVHYGLSLGKWSYVDGKLFIDLPESDLYCADGDAYYNVWVIRQGDEVTKLRFEEVRRDPCPGRRASLNGQTIVRYKR